jgi:PAN domain-containing protein
MCFRKRASQDARGCTRVRTGRDNGAVVAEMTLKHKHFHALLLLAAVAQAVCVAAAVADKGKAIGSDTSLNERADDTIGQYEDEGFRQDGQKRVALIAKDGKDQFSVQLARRLEYAVVAVCGSGCDKVTVTLSDGLGRPIAVSNGDSFATSAQTTVAAPGAYTVKVAAPGCGRALCSLRTVVLLRDPKSQSATIAPLKGRQPGLGGVPEPAKPSAPAPPTLQQTPPAPPQAASSETMVPPLRGAPRPEPFQIFDNYDVIGFDLEVIKNSSADACAAICLRNRDCVVYSFDKWNHVCFPKSKGGELTFTPRSLTAVRAGTPVPRYSAAGVNFERFRNKRFPDPGDSARTTASLEACQELCLKGGMGCAAFSFIKSNRKCVLFSRTDVYQPDADADSGAKTQSTQ